MASVFLLPFSALALLSFSSFLLHFNDCDAEFLLLSMYSI
jgi:hypothetical protein